VYARYSAFRLWFLGREFPLAADPRPGPDPGGVAIPARLCGLSGQFPRLDCGGCFFFAAFGIGCGVTRHQRCDVSCKENVARIREASLTSQGITNNRDTNRNQTFTYDPLNRLLSAQNAGTDCNAKLPDGHTEYWGNSYVYDAWGNLNQKQVTKCSAENLSMGIAVNNRAQGGSYLHDVAGNMLLISLSGL
jgi:hypothetical protein